MYTWLINLPDTIFQVEKAFREGTARQNAHSIFVSLALKLLEERIHVACKEIVTLEKQVKIIIYRLITPHGTILISSLIFVCRQNFLKKRRKKSVKRKSERKGGELKKRKKNSEEKRE